MFKDCVNITIRSGKGGDGAVSFRRELYIPNGGPDGGDGGKGGDLIAEVDKGLNTLSDFRVHKVYAAGNGEAGGAKRCHGKNGEDLVLKVPEGTLIKDESTGLIVCDMSGGTKREIILYGGRGGLGNQHFATASMQAPRYAEKGKPGRELKVTLELKLIADAGLVGFPNAGKSTILSHVSNAAPKIASYPFTTLEPMLGVVDVGDYQSFVLADIPGLIEGASGGAGLGDKFLRHIERCKVLVIVADSFGSDMRDPLSDILVIEEELKRFSKELKDKKKVIALNKIDCLIDREIIDKVKALYEPRGIKVFPVSAATGEGVRDLVGGIYDIIKSEPHGVMTYDKEFDPNGPIAEELSLNIYKEAPHVYVVEGTKIDKMLSYTRLDTARGFKFFQDYMRENGIIDKLKEMGLSEEDTVRVSGSEFTYYE